MSSPSVCVFLGPSLPLADARRILDAVYLPPVSMGDIYRVMMTRPPRAIAIIDGLFEQTPAVWHKEILFALSRGVRVLGASSMGALRAAELAAFGMQGVGEVFEAFHRGELEDDDEVAVVHAAAADGYRSLSDAMVNLRAGLREARAAGRISASSHDRLVAAGKALFYPDRSWPRLFAVAGGLGIPDAELGALREQVAGRRPDVKRADAIRLLELLAAEGTASGAPTRHSRAGAGRELRFRADLFLGADDPARGGGRWGGGRRQRWPGRRGQRRRASASPARRSSSSTRRARHRAAALSRRRAGGAPGPRRRWCVASTADAGVPSSALLAPGARAELERGRRAIDALMQAVPDQVNRRLPAALAHLGQLEPTLIQVRRKQAILRSLGLRAAAPADAGLTLEDLLTWYQGRFGAMAGAPEEHAHALGFASVEEFAAEVVLEYLAAQHTVT